MERVRRFFGIGDQATLPALNPNVTQRFVADKYREEKYHASSDYVYGRQNASPGTPMLTLEQYIDMVRGFGKLAMTMDRTKDHLLPTYEELEELVEVWEEPHFEEEGL